MTFGLPVPFSESTSPTLKRMPAHVPRSPPLVSLLHLPLAEYPIPFNPTHHCVMKNSGCIQSRLSWRTHLLSQFSPSVKCRFSSTSPRPRAFLGLAIGHRSDLNFVRLDLGAPITSSECLVEMEAPNGSKMRMSFRGQRPFFT